MKIKTNLLLILAVLSIFIIIPSSFAADLNESATDLDLDDSNQEVVTANENVIYVSPTADEGDGSEGNPYNLSTAVSAYDSSVNSKIIMKNGEYKFTEQLNLNKNINIEGESYNGVILNGTDVCSILKASTGNIVLSNLKFVNGYSEFSYSTNYAGGLHVGSVKHITLNNCIFEGNANGGLTASGSNSIIDIWNCEFISNYVTSDYSIRGGAINIAASDSQVNIINTTFKDNYVNAPMGSGAAIYGGSNFESMLIDNCKFINNTAPDEGSAIYIYCGGNLTVLKSEFINQTSPVIYDNQRNQRQLYLFIKDLTFDNSSSDNIIVEGKVNLVDLSSNDRINGNNIKMNVGDDENYTVTLTDGDGNPISGKQIIATLTDYFDQVTTLNTITDNNGQAIFSMKNQKPGTYKVFASFAGDGTYNAVNTTNTILIKAEELFSIIMIPESVKIREGDSYIVTGIIVDEYYEPSYDFSSSSVNVEWYNPGKHSLTNGAIVDGCYFTFDIAQCSLKTSDTPYVITFIIDPGIYTGYIDALESSVLVNLSVTLPDIEDTDVIYVAADGSDITGNGTEENPLATVQLALTLNDKLGGGKTIIVGEGTYDISNFNILSDVTIIGDKSKTVFRQVSGKNGMFKIFQPVTVNFINLTFINGYTTPMPYSLITAYGEGVLVNIDGCEFRNNTCLNGGAIAISHGAYVYATDSKFINNRGILIQSAGGAIFVLDGYLKATGCEFINNTACDGAAIWVGYPGTADIIDSTFKDNFEYNGSVVLGGGGAIYTKGVTAITNSSFINNYATLYGGAIYVAGGETTIKQSYFENNTVGPSYDGSVKGSAIQSEPWTTFYLNVEDSIFLTDDTYNYIALFSNNEDASIGMNYNYWGSNKWNRMNTNVAVYDYVIIQARSETNPVYKDTPSNVYVEFKNYNVDSASITELSSSMHEYTVAISSVLNDIETKTVNIVNNYAQDAYYPVNTGLETITVAGTTLNFQVADSTKKDVNANITITPGTTTTITVEVPADLENYVTIKVQNKEFTKSADNGIITVTLDTLPGDYKVIVSYDEDSNYKGFSNTTLFSIPKYKSDLNVSASNVYEDQSATVDVNITNGASGTVTIILNGKYRYTAVINSGKAFKVFYNLDIGNYTVDVIYEGNDYYEGCNGSTSFEVIQRPPEPVEPVDGYAYISIQTGSTSTITVRLPANLTNNVTVNVNDDVYSFQSGNGVIKFNVTTDIADDYTVGVSYDGDENYNPFTAYKTFRIYDYCWFINETGYRTLREAVEAAGDGDVIKGNISVYEIDETVDIGHREMPSEPWEIIKNVTITSMYADKPVTIKGVSKRLFYIDKDSHLTLSNLILTGSDVGVLDGGAVENTYDAYVTILNCTFTNFTADRGGALFLWGQALVKDSIFINNYATLGGAIFVLSPATNDNNVIFDNITVIDNTAVSYGGGLYISGSFANRTILKNSNFINNTGHGKGGALYIMYGNVVIENTLFDSNAALDYDFENEVEKTGGAIHVSNYVNVDISDSRFINNYAHESAGAIACDNAKTGIQDLTTGEIIWTYYTTNIKNCSFVNNSAGKSAGVMYIGISQVPTVNIIDSIFDSNRAPEGATIINTFGLLTIKNTEFVNNVAENASLIITYGVYSEEAFNAETEIIDCTFNKNNVAYDIYQVNSYTILTIEYSNFTDDAIILINHGTATLSNMIQSTGDSNYSIINNNQLSLNHNTFTASILNNGRIITETYIIVLDNETVSGEFNSICTLKAVVCDDNGNIIEKGNLTFLIDGNELAAVYDNGEFTADYKLVDGSHIINAKYTDTGLSNLKVKTALLVAKKASNMVVNMEDIEYGDNLIITVNVDVKATGNVTVKIGNKTYDAIIKNGEAKFVIEDLAIGDYEVEITYAGDDDYALKSQTSALNVSKMTKYNFAVNAINVTTNSAVINITLPIDFNGEVIAVVDNNPQKVMVKNGQATVQLNNLAIGNHNVEVTFNGTDKYAESTVKTSFKVSKLESSVMINIKEVIIGNDAIINLILPDDATGDVIVTVANKDYPATIYNGKAIVNIPDLEIGEYDVEALYIGDGKYLGSNNRTTFKVTDKPTVKKSFIDLTIDSTIIKGTLKDNDGNSIINASVYYSIDGIDTGNLTTNENGEFTIQGIDGRKFTFEFMGNTTLYGSAASVTLKDIAGKISTVIIANSNLTRTAVDLAAGENGGIFNITLKDSNGNVLANKTVQVTLNGETTEIITDSQGIAGLKVNIANAGTYYYVISFKGDGQYEASSIVISKLTVNKKKTTIKATAKKFKAKKKTKKVTVTLKTSANEFDKKTYLGAGKKLTLKVNGKTYTAKTNKKGKATFKVKKLTKKGKYKAVIKFKGDNTYKASSKKIKIKIK